MKAVNPFLERIPTDEHDAFLDDYVSAVADMQLALDDIETNSSTCRFLTPYKLLIAYARKWAFQFVGQIIALRKYLFIN